nr:MAG TPA: Recombination ATPase helicase [Caudoviricetes sp.]
MQLETNQMTAVEKITCEPTKAALNASLMGTGKTLMAVEVAKKLNAKVILIVAPLNTYWGWYDTIQRQTGYTSKIQRIDSTTKGKQAFADLESKVEGWYFIGREYFRTKEWSKIVPDMAMIDECHFAQNRNSKSFKALMKLDAKFKLSMSGTPYGNNFEGFWAITRWLWPDKIPKSFWSWVFTWGKTAYSPFSKYDIVGELNPGAFAKSLPCYVRLEPNHNLEVVEETRYVDLVPAQRKIYEKFERDLVVWLQDNPMVAEVPIAARIRLRQITLAVPSIAEDGSVYFEDNAVSTKFKALQEIIDDNPSDSMLVLTDSQKYAKIVTARLNAKKEVAFEWSGNANQKQREEAKQKFLRGEIKYIVAVVPAIAEGVDGLQDVCSTIVWLSHSDSNLMNQQVIDRIRRRGQKEIVKIYDIVARDTYDDPQIANLMKKELSMRASLKSKEK